MGHIDAILNNVANAQEQQRLQDQINNPLPHLGRVTLTAMMIDMFISEAVANGRIPFPYNEIEGYDFDSKIEAAHFVVGKFIPDTESEKPVVRDALRMREELYEFGCYASFYEHSIEVDGGEIRQEAIVVPTIKPEFVELATGLTDKKSTQTNIKQLAIFMAYLIKEVLVDPDHDRDNIIKAVGARGLHLAMTQYLPAMLDLPKDGPAPP